MKRAATAGDPGPSKKTKTYTNIVNAEGSNNGNVMIVYNHKQDGIDYIAANESEPYTYFACGTQYLTRNCKKITEEQKKRLYEYKVYNGYGSSLVGMFVPKAIYDQVLQSMKEKENKEKETAEKRGEKEYEKAELYFEESAKALEASFQANDATFILYPFDSESIYMNILEKGWDDDGVFLYSGGSGGGGRKKNITWKDKLDILSNMYRERIRKHCIFMKVKEELPAGEVREDKELHILINQNYWMCCEGNFKKACEVIIARFNQKKEAVKAQKNFEAEVQEAHKRIFHLFPHIPPANAKQIIDRAWNQGGVGKSSKLPLDSKIKLATEAHVRYQLTNFASLKQTYEYNTAWLKVKNDIVKTMKEWTVGKPDTNLSLIQRMSLKRVKINPSNGTTALPFSIINKILAQVKKTEQRYQKQVLNEMYKIVDMSMKNNEATFLTMVRQRQIEREEDEDDDDDDSDDSGISYDSSGYGGYF